MSNPPESSIFGKMTSRAAGKRQIKPTAILYATLNENQSSDEEDEDFEVKIDKTSSKNNSGSDNGSSNSDEENSDEEESENSEDVEKEDEECEVRKNRDSAEKQADIVCGVCVNMRDVVVAGDFMQCDKCGIHVHESCYQGIQVDDPEETIWYCEPCAYGLTDPPHCEFCPSRLGAFKRSEIPGRWCHVVCALFTHGVVFVQAETLTGVSWESLDNQIFGKRTCSACTDKIEARLGIASRCESGMCKEYMHITCAQKNGLLVDETDDHDEDVVAMMRYFFCKKHTNHDNLKPLQRKYQNWEKAESRRMTLHRRRRPLTEEEEKFRIEILEKLEKIMKSDIEKNPYVVPAEDRQKQARLLNTSSEFFDRFETKAEDSGVSRDAFREPFFNIKLTNSMHMPMGFSKEYIDFIHLRDHQIIPEEEGKLLKARELLDETKKRHAENAQHRADIYADNDETYARKTEKLDDLYNLLSDVVGNSDSPTNKWLQKVFDVSRRSQERHSVPKEIEHKCVVCELTTEQHKQTQCDQCHQSYHIHCLTPPLSRLPKRMNFGWICHVCNESDDSDEPMDTSDDPTTSGRATRSRRPPARLSGFVEH